MTANTNHTTSPTDELDDMKRQLAALHRKIDRMLDTDEQLLRRAVRHRAGRLNRRGFLRAVLILACIPLIVTTFARDGFSWPFCAVTALFLLTADLNQFYIYRDLRKAATAGNDLRRTAAATWRIKRLHARGLRVGLPCAALWFAWFVAESLRLDHGREFAIAGSVGAVVGLAIGLTEYHRTMRTATHLLNDLQALEATDDAAGAAPGDRREP